MHGSLIVTLKILHRDQLKNKNVRIADQNLAIKSLQSKITVHLSVHINFIFFQLARI